VHFTLTVYRSPCRSTELHYEVDLVCCPRQRIAPGGDEVECTSIEDSDRFMVTDYFGSSWNRLRRAGSE
jgi:hypothetical protein